MDFIRRVFGAKPKTSTLDKDTTKPTAHPVNGPDTQPINRPAAAAQLTVNMPIPPVTPKEVERDDDPTPAVPELTPMPAPGTRQLPPLEASEIAPGKSGQHITYGISSDVGMIRSNNQDALFTFLSSNVSADSNPDFGVFVVADGMGGHHDGEKASAITARMVGKYILDKFFMPLLNHRKDDTDDMPIISEVLSGAVQEANRAVSDDVPEGGTTVTAAAIFGGLVYLGHVGDSRAYLITGDDIEQITRDHSLVQRLIELDQLTPEEAAVHPQRNVLYRAVGQSENLEVDTVTRRLPPGSRLLLCSDGLWNQIDKPMLLNIVMAARSPQEACDKLIAVANERGGPDNITAVLIQIPT